jgi:hypothetical protein
VTATSRLIGIADEYGTIWKGEPGASERIGDLVQRGDGETSEVRLSGRVRVRDLEHEASCGIFDGNDSCDCGAVVAAVKDARRA